MEKDLSDFRKSYEKNSLLESNTPDSPITLFTNWFENANANFPESETNAMTLSTLGFDGYPKGRVVLLKKFSIEGFVFFTNYLSEKGKSISKYPKVSLAFYWEGAEQQVIIKGDIEKISEIDSDIYFNSRPRDSQLGAHVSEQSSVINNRIVLDQRMKSLEEKFLNKTIKRPNFWGGYIVKPVEIEFWQGRKSRLHDRIRYKLDNNFNWIKERLSP